MVYLALSPLFPHRLSAFWHLKIGEPIHFLNYLNYPFLPYLKVSFLKSGKILTSGKVLLQLEFFFILEHFIYLFFLAEEGGREEERERNIDMREKYPPAASCTCHDWGLYPQPRHVT